MRHRRQIVLGFLLAFGFPLFLLVAGLAGVRAASQTDPVSGAAQGSPSVPSTLYLPSVTYPEGVIYGQVTENGVGAADVPVTLTFCKQYRLGSCPPCIPSCWEKESFHTTTNESGYYRFTGPSTLTPSLAPGDFFFQYYEVEWNNGAANPQHLASWNTRRLGEYTVGDIVNIGDFDIANVSLTGPISGTTTTLPVTLTWQLRPATPDDTYAAYMCSEARRGIKDYWGCETLVAVGYQDHFIFAGPVITDWHYDWRVEVQSPDGGYGHSFERYTIRFTDPP